VKQRGEKEGINPNMGERHGPGKKATVAGKKGERNRCAQKEKKETGRGGGNKRKKKDGQKNRWRVGDKCAKKAWKGSTEPSSRCNRTGAMKKGNITGRTCNWLGAAIIQKGQFNTIQKTGRERGGVKKIDDLTKTSQHVVKKVGGGNKGGPNDMRNMLAKKNPWK